MRTNIIFPIATALSSLCLIVLLIYWYLVPKWRNLQNYITIQQIFTGTLQLCCSSILILSDSDMSNDYWSTILDFNNNLFLLYLCWSLCNSLVAYLKLVLVYSGSKSYEKRIASAFSYGTFFVISNVCNFVHYGLKERVLISLDESELYIYEVVLVPVYLIVTINLAMFVRVVLVVYSVSERSPRTNRHITSLGVGLFCDVITTVYMIVCLLYYSVVFSHSNISKPELRESSISEKYAVVLVIQFAFAFRLIPQFIVVLFNKSSRDLWKRYLDDRRRKLDANR